MGRNPLFEQRLFQAQTFRWTNVAMLAFATGFRAMFLGNILCVTGVWHYRIVQAGLAVSIDRRNRECTRHEEA